MFMTPECVAPTGCTLGEGPLWSPSEGFLWWVDIKRAKLHRYNPRTGNTRRYDLPIRASTLALFDGNILMAGEREIGVYDPATEAYERLRTLDAEPISNRTNDGGIAPDGSFWFGTMDDSQKVAQGNYYRYTSDGKLEPLRLPSVMITNTFQFSPDGSVFYTCDSVEQEVLSFQHEIGTGKVTDRKVLANTFELSGYPDGSAVDSEGCLWTCLWDASRIVRLTPDGEIDRTITLAAPRPTSLTFGDEDLKTLFITTARAGMSFPQLDSRPLSGSLFAVRVDVPGLPPREFSKSRE
ncbi:MULTISPECIES: SMP-30/gluconolactonase/LRE family protein [Hyphomonas]|jgi:sugar lactone lactonase YvrE